MAKDINRYFDKTIMPLIRNRHADILPEASIMFLGSVGLRIDDEFSDMEAVLYLPDTIWKQNGVLQIELEECLAETNPWKQDGMVNGSIISVHPLSWLLDYQGEKILSSNGCIKWEKLSFESLFTIQENLIYHDPQDRFGRLRRLTAVEKMPDTLWKKAIYTKLKDFVEDGVRVIQISVNRRQFAAANIQFGRTVQTLYELGFLICHRYYPYLKHLRWAFGRLPEPIASLNSYFDILSATSDWSKRLSILETIYDAYKTFIVSNAVFPEIDFDLIDLHDMRIHTDLGHANWFQAWENPDWRESLNALKEKTVRLGYAPDMWWIVDWYNLGGSD